jgi:hypothetical protein
MRALTAIIIASFLLAGSAYGQNGSKNENASFLTPKSVTADNNALIVIAQDTTVKPKKKIKLRRVCPADQIRCACADTGTSACCMARRLAVVNRPLIAADLQGPPRKLSHEPRSP